jgi:hypothetical protein
MNMSKRLFFKLLPIVIVIGFLLPILVRLALTPRHKAANDELARPKYEEHFTRWRDQKVSRYRVTMFSMSEKAISCPGAELVVVEGRVINVSLPEKERERVSLENCEPYYQSMTIDSVFEMIDGSLDRMHAPFSDVTIEVEYDETYGFPEHVIINDLERYIFTVEITFSDFERLEPYTARGSDGCLSCIHKLNY